MPLMTAARLSIVHRSCIALLGFVISSCSTYDTKWHHELIGVQVDVAFAQINAKPFYDKTLTVSETRGLYTAILKKFPLKDTKDDKRLIRVVNWNSDDRFIRVLCLKDRGKWIIFDVIDVPSKKIF